MLAAKAAHDREMLEQELIDIKMSKSNPSSAIFVHDSEEEIRKKVNGTFCPINETEVNPLIDMVNFIVWPYFVRNGLPFEIENRKKNTKATFGTPEGFEAAYRRGEVHPLDLKGFVSDALVSILGPARKYFLEGAGKKYLDEMKEIKITR